VSATGAALIVVLLALAGLHLYWGLGGRWPGHDDASLIRIVAGAQGGRMYGFLACAAVAFALGSAAAIVAARHSAIMSSGFAWIIIAGYGVLILVFALRGLAPYVTPVFEYARGTPFFELNRLYYAPLCLLIAAGLAINFPRPS
jgi:hypothetical protein